MKILFFNYEYPPLGGGAGNATFYLLREFSKIPGLEVDLVTSSIGNFRMEKISSNITVHHLNIHKKSYPHYQSMKDLIFYSIKTYSYSKKLIRKNHYDLTHSFFSVPCGFISWLFFRKYKIPYIVSLRGADVPGYAERFSKIYKLLKPLIKKIWKDASEVISNSEGLKRLALESSRDQKIGIIYNGVETKEFKPADRSLASGSEAKLLKSNKFIITPGASRITARKGLKYLVEAVEKLAKNHPEIRLEIIGDGSERKNLEAQVTDSEISDKVKFAGVVPHNETAKFYQRANIFVLPSLNEGMSNAMLEALASGLPVITTDTGGTRELVRDGINGFYVRMRDGRDIAQKIEKLMNNKELAGKMAAESRRIAETMNWQSVAKNYYHYYESICKANLASSKIMAKLQSNKNKIKLAVKLIVMSGFIAWLIQKIEWPIVLTYLKQMDIWWMLAFMAIYTLGVSISTYKWKILADFKNIYISYSELFKVYLTGAFINNFFPSIIGGDTYRSFKLGQAGKDQYLKAASTVLIDRITGFFGVMVLILIFSLFNLKTVLANPVLITINVIILLSFGFEFFLLILRLLPIWNYVKNIFPQKITELIQEIFSYRGKGILFKAIIWGIIFNFVGIGLASWMIFQDLHIPITFSQFMIAISIVSIVSSIPISIGNIGIKEWAFITFFGIFAVNGEAAISIAIFGRFLQMIVNFFAIPYYLKEKKNTV